MYCNKCDYFKENKCVDEVEWFDPEDGERCCRYRVGAIAVNTGTKEIEQRIKELEERLQISPYGDDKIGELEECIGYKDREIEQLKQQVEAMKCCGNCGEYVTDEDGDESCGLHWEKMFACHPTVMNGDLRYWNLKEVQNEER